MNTQEFITRLPKTDLHVHLDGSLRHSTLLELADQFECEVPEGVFRETYKSLEEYLNGFKYTCAVMRDEASIARITYELCIDAFSEGVYYQEIRFAPQLLEHDALNSLQILMAASDGIKQAEAEFNDKNSATVDLYRGALIVCAMRFPEQFANKSIEAVNTAIAARDELNLPVVAFDLAGAEFGNPAQAHSRAYAIALEAGLSRTVHAGEADGAASIADAITSCHAQRIGHGTHLLQDSDLVMLVRDRDILLEVCLTSNMQTMPHLKDLSEHPFVKFIELDIPFTLATDNRLVSHTTICKEYQLAAVSAQLSHQQLAKIARNGFAAMFFPGSSAEASEYKRAVQAEHDKLIAIC
ncbi:MAG: adenosine deaminase [Myxococcota bacterium]|jgi:adenosine deaminase